MKKRSEDRERLLDAADAIIRELDELEGDPELEDDGIDEPSLGPNDDGDGGTTWADYQSDSPEFTTGSLNSNTLTRIP